MLWPPFTIGDFWDFARPVALAGAGVALALFILLFAIWWRLKPLFGLAAAALITSFLPIALHSDLLPLRALSSPWTPWLGAAVFLCPLGLIALFLLRQIPDPKRNEASIILIGLSTLLPLAWLIASPFIVGPGTFDGAILLAIGLPALLVAALLSPGWRAMSSGWLLIGGALSLLASALLLMLALMDVSRGATAETLFLLGQLIGITLFVLAPLRNATRAPAMGRENVVLRSQAEQTMQTNQALIARNLELGNLRDELEERRTELTQATREAEAQVSELMRVSDTLHQLRQSIDYARRIQQALLPSEAQIRELLGEAFILNQPRDTVSGDFYWAERFDDDWTLLCVADCTGHGVPGAFMTALGCALLNQIVRERKIRRPDQVLFVLDRELKDALGKNGHKMRDGMEMGVLMLSPDRSQALYSGARMPLLHLRGDKLTVVNGVRRTIGDTRGESHTFNIQQVDIRQGDSIYIASDGYQDQMGGSESRRYLSGRFRETLTWLGSLSASEQKENLQKVFRSWKGEHPQTDDMLVVGFKV